PPSAIPYHVPLPPSGTPRDLHSFPTRRSSDLQHVACFDFSADVDNARLVETAELHFSQVRNVARDFFRSELRIASNDVQLFDVEDRKSTRLNSSHDQISYAVFCLKKKKMKKYY